MPLPEDGLSLYSDSVWIDGIYLGEIIKDTPYRWKVTVSEGWESCSTDQHLALTISNLAFLPRVFCILLLSVVGQVYG